MTASSTNAPRESTECVEGQPSWSEARIKLAIHQLQSPDLLLTNGLNRDAGFLLIAAGNKLLTLLTAQLAALNLKLKHFNILLIVGQQGALSQFALGEQVGLSCGAMVQNLDYLERRGLLQRHKHKGSDRRPNNIVLTQPGIEVLLQGLDFLQQAEAEMMVSLSPEEQAQLQLLMSRLDLTL
jgi:DNA-binding MarR family transcriptional regulator